MGIKGTKNKNYEKGIDGLLKRCNNPKKKFKQYQEIMLNLFQNNLHSFFSEVKKHISEYKEDEMKKNFENNIKQLFELLKKENDVLLKRALSSLYGAFLGDSMGASNEFKHANTENYKRIFADGGTFGKGCVTDDSEMAMSMAFGIMDNPDIQKLNPSYNFYFYGLWYKSSPKDIGTTTRIALKNFDTDKHHHPVLIDFKKICVKYKTKNQNSKANGFLMRFSPFIVWYYFVHENEIQELFEPFKPFMNSSDNMNNNTEQNNNDNNELIQGNNDNELIQGKASSINVTMNEKKLTEMYEDIKVEAEKDNICTHTNEELPSASAFYTLMGIAALHGLNSEQIIYFLSKILVELKIFQESDDNSKYKHDIEVAKFIKTCLNDYQQDLQKTEDNKSLSYARFGIVGEKDEIFKSMGFYRHGFKLTLYYLTVLSKYKDEDKTVYRQIMEEIVCFGGDTDTNAAIVGTIIGPVIGIDRFGKEDLEMMINAYSEERMVFSPPLMYIYVKYLSKYKNQKKRDEKENNLIVLKMFLNLFVKKVEEEEKLIEDIIS